MPHNMDEIIAGFDSFQDEFWARCETNMKTVMGILLADAKAGLTANDTGQLRAQTAVAVEASNTAIRGVIYNPLNYAPFVHQGTGIHAVGGKGRRTPWVYKGRHGFFRTIGMKPHPFIREAVENNRDEIDSTLGRAP